MSETSGHQERPRIVLFVHTAGVSSLFVAGQLERFAASGFEPHYAAGWGEHDSPPDVGCPTWRLPLVRPPSPLRDAWAVASGVRLLRRLRPDVVHAGTPKAGLVMMIAATICRCPVRLYAVHGLRYETTTGVRRRVLRSFERVSARCSTHVVADGASLRGVLADDLGIPADKIHVLGPGSSNGVDVERFSGALGRHDARLALGLDDDVAVLGFVGRLTHDKGLDDLVEIHRRIGADRRVVLVLVGDYEDDDPVADATHRHIDEHPDVIRIPWTDRPEQIYPAMDLLVFPSLREGLPNVPLEAQSAGIPVVGYAATGTVDAVADPDRLVDVGDITALTASIVELLADPEAVADRSRAARTWVVSFDRNAVWDARVEFVRRCLSDAARTRR